MSQRAYYEYRLRPAPIKLIFLLIVFSIVLKKNPEGTVSEYILPFIIAYGVLSTYVAFAFAAENWYMGFVFLTIVILIVAFNFEKLPKWFVFLLIVCFMFGGVLHDIYCLVRLIICMARPNKYENWQDNREIHSNGQETAALRAYINEYNNRISVCRQLFDELSQAIKTEHSNPDKASSLLEEYHSICNTAEALADRMAKSNGIPEIEIHGYAERISACCVDLQILQEKQRKCIQEVRAGKWKRQERKGAPQSNPKNTANDFLNGCSDLDSLNKRYRDLCKVYHPDMGNGSAEIFQKVNAEYEMMKKSMK